MPKRPVLEAKAEAELALSLGKEWRRAQGLVKATEAAFIAIKRGNQSWPYGLDDVKKHIAYWRESGELKARFPDQFKVYERSRRGLLPYTDEDIDKFPVQSIETAPVDEPAIATSLSGNPIPARSSGRLQHPARASKLIR